MVRENNIKITKLSAILSNARYQEFFERKASKFSCLNKDVEMFLRDKAISYEQRGKSRTYILSEEDSGDIVAYFTLSLKSLDFGNTVSKSTIKDIDGFSKDVESVAVVLIGQLGKDAVKGERLTGTDLLETALGNIYTVNDIVGGRICLLETEDAPGNQKVIDFYAYNGFKVLQHDKTDKYLQMFRKL